MQMTIVYWIAKNKSRMLLDVRCVCMSVRERAPVCVGENPNVVGACVE